MAMFPSLFEAVTREMTFTLFKSGRSSVLNTCRDFSSAIITGDGHLFMIEEGIPVHVGAINLVVQEALKYFDDLMPGDCIMNNCPYTGNTHHADVTLSVPVFHDDELVFWVVNRAHQADIGAPIPSMYLPYAKEIYEEGLHFPCLRVQRDYRDLKDIIRMCRMKIRVPDQWYGDYLAQIGAVRIGERRVAELLNKHGISKLKIFVEDWLNYSEQLVIKSIRGLPKATLKREIKYDPVPSVATEGIPLKVEITIDPEAPNITVDLTDNIDNLPCGLNLSYATTLAAVYSGIFFNLDPDIPHNEGSLRHITVKVAEGKIAGIPKHPVGTSVATTNLCDRLFNLVWSAFGQLGMGHGKAESLSGVAATCFIASGTDWRRGGRPFINQFNAPAAYGGPASYGHDGWVTFIGPCVSGVMNLDSIELTEQRFPIIFDCSELMPDSGGAGQWDGAPGSITIYGPRKNPMTCAWIDDAHVYPPRGILGGESGLRHQIFKIDVEGREKALPVFGLEILQPGEKMMSILGGSGGYGSPLDRDPELVRKLAKAEWITLKRAREVYGVMLKTETERFEVDYEATERLRRKMRGERI